MAAAAAAVLAAAAAPYERLPTDRRRSLDFHSSI